MSGWKAVAVFSTVKRIPFASSLQAFLRKFPGRRFSLLEQSADAAGQQILSKLRHIIGALMGAPVKNDTLNDHTQVF